MDEFGWALKAGDLVVSQSAPSRIKILRIRGNIAEQAKAVADKLGVALADVPNRATGRQPRVISLAPGDWMIVDLAGEHVLRPYCGAEALAHFADVTDGRVVFTVMGASARDLLAKGTSVDLHRSVFPQDHCAQTLFAQIRVLIDHHADNAFQLFADVSFAAYLRTWFENAIQEFLPSHGSS